MVIYSVSDYNCDDGSSEVDIGKSKEFMER